MEDRYKYFIQKSFSVFTQLYCHKRKYHGKMHKVSAPQVVSAGNRPILVSGIRTWAGLEQRGGRGLNIAIGLGVGLTGPVTDY